MTMNIYYDKDADLSIIRGKISILVIVNVYPMVPAGAGQNEMILV